MNKIQQFSMAIVAVVMIAGFSAFKMEENSSIKAFTDGWYDVSPDPLFPSDESKQILSTTPNNTPPPEIDHFGCAQTINSGERCSVYLTFGSGATIFPTTVGDADLDPDVDIEGESRMPL